MKNILVKRPCGGRFAGVSPLAPQEIANSQPASQHPFFTRPGRALSQGNWHTHLFAQVKHDVEQIRAVTMAARRRRLSAQQHHRRLERSSNQV